MGKLAVVDQQIKLGDKLSVPAVGLATSVSALIGMRGSGKSNLAAVIVEGLCGLKIPVVVLDYVGIWASLRLAPDGKTPSGIDIPVLGGPHGDLTLTDHDGRTVAQALARSNSSAVLDVSSLSKAGRMRFAADFAESFFESKKKLSGPCLLVLEEAQRYIPQKLFKGQGLERMLGAFEEIAEVGRNFGVGMLLLSQRPQKLNKDVLNLAQTLFAFQLSGRSERVAIQEWVAETKAVGRDTVSGDLPSIPIGSALVWSPSWLKVFGQYAFLKKRTFDAGATPTVLRTQAALKLLDLAALKEALAKSGSEVTTVGADPELAAHVKALEEKCTILKERLHSLEAILEGTKHTDLQNKALRSRLDEIQRLAQTALVESSEFPGPPPGDGWITGDHGEIRPRPQSRPTEDPIPIRVAPPKGDFDDHTKLIGKMHAIGEVLATFHPDGMSKTRIAMFIGMASGGGGFNNYLGALKRGGFIQSAGDVFSLTHYGVTAFRRPGMRKPTGEDLVKVWEPNLPSKAVQMVRYLMRFGKKSKDDLAAAVDMTPGGGGFNNYLGMLRRAGLIEADGASYRVVADLK